MSKKSRDDGEPKKLKNNVYMKELRKLQEKLCHLQDWVKFKGLRAIIVFEGRDGKGGTIRALTEKLSPRVFPAGGIASALRPREVANVHTALHSALPG